MKELAIEFINIIENNGYQAYIVGGFVRDYILGINSTDIDITSSATPKEIKKIFKDYEIKTKTSDDSYGSLIVNYKNTLFEVTTFRKEYDYLDNRHPSKIEYVKDLVIDLKRRDFTINAICIDKFGKIIDPLNGTKDLKNKIIKTIIDSNKSFKDDALRILRALRFSIILNFKLDKELINSIDKEKKYLKNISYERKKIELDKIFASKNAKEGIELIQKLKLDNYLDLTNLDKIKDYSDLIGIWSIINSNNYRFTKHEKELIKKVNIVYQNDKLDSYTLYKYGLYVCILAFSNKGISKKKINLMYNNIPIKSKSDIDIKADEICNILNRKPDYFLNEIYNDLEKKILNKEIKNQNSQIVKYIKEKYLK